jgi:hypothetical protein
VTEVNALVIVGHGASIVYEEESRVPAELMAKLKKPFSGRSYDRFNHHPSLPSKVARPDDPLAEISPASAV